MLLSVISYENQSCSVVHWSIHYLDSHMCWCLSSQAVDLVRNASSMRIPLEPLFSERSGPWSVRQDMDRRHVDDIHNHRLRTFQ